MENNTDLVKRVIELGAAKAAIISAKDIQTDAKFRDMCASNACGKYGRCWMCPPDIGDIDTLMQSIYEYKYALVYQTIDTLEDSFDYEGMIEARRKLTVLSLDLRKLFDSDRFESVLHLSVGGCGVCEKCTKPEGQPCRHPELATPSLEAYGVNVSKLAEISGMKYINGADTVTYFGAVLFTSKDGE